MEGELNLFAERKPCLGVAQRDAIANAIDGIAPGWLRGFCFRLCFNFGFLAQTRSVLAHGRNCSMIRIGPLGHNSHPRTDYPQHQQHRRHRLEFRQQHSAYHSFR